VTTLGEFSLIGPLFSLVSFLKITQKAHILGLHFTQQKLCSNFDKMLGWPTFLAICQQSHLVTLLTGAVRHFNSLSL
jgi:hypothetical protein